MKQVATDMLTNRMVTKYLLVEGERHTVQVPSRVVSEASGPGPPWFWHVPTHPESWRLLFIKATSLLWTTLFANLPRRHSSVRDTDVDFCTGGLDKMAIDKVCSLNHNASTAWAVMHRRITGSHSPTWTRAGKTSFAIKAFEIAKWQTILIYFSHLISGA